MISFQPVHSEAQIADVARLAREIWQEHYVPIIGQAQVDYMLENFQSETALSKQLQQAYEYYLITNNRQSAGYLAIVPGQNDASLMLSKLYVRKSERGRGLGKQGLHFVEDLCAKRAVNLLWLTVNKHNADSIAWYSQMGFTNAGSIIQDIGSGFVMDDFRFEKAIPK
jgi:GNAT superfamily N-acetyltransferase